jgi:predicted nicotinamide N-methyase
VPGIRLQLADEVLPLWHAVQTETGDPDASLPYWAFAWSGGLALARYLREQPGVLRGRRVVEIGSGSGLCAIVAADCGASDVLAIDVDPLAAAAIALNARLNRVRLRIALGDPLDQVPPDTDVILAGDLWYEPALAGRATRWLEAAHVRGSAVLLGDPGRRYLPTTGLVHIATYDVRTTTELEDLERKQGHVHTFRETAAHRPMSRDGGDRLND